MSVTLGAEVTDEGAGPVVTRGFQITLRNHPFPAEEFGIPTITIPVQGTIGSFTASAASYAMAQGFGTEFIFRAVAINEFGFGYSEPVEFEIPFLPVVDAVPAADVTATTATLGGDVVSDAEASITERGVVYAVTSENPDPQLDGPGVTKVATTGTIGAFSLPVPGLAPATSYTFRSYATIPNDRAPGDLTGYSNPLSFETAGSPRVGGVSVVSVSENTATLAGEVTSDGGLPLTERGIVFAEAAVNDDPRLEGDGVTKIVSPGQTGAFTVEETGLAEGREYVCRAFASNEQGTGYGNVLEFATLKPDDSGKVDTAFAASLAGSDPFSLIHATAVQPDGKVLIVGRFNQVNGVARSNIARLNADGTLDSGFNASVSSEASCVVVLPDGKILVGGQYWSTVNGESKGSLVRLNADGTLDAGFAANVEGWILSMVPLADGKILIGGTISQISGDFFNSTIARLNADGTLDSGFGGSTDYGFTSALAVQPDGKILVGGVFSSLNGDSNYGRFGRLNPDGSLDTSFIPGAQPNVFPNGSVGVIAVQPDGKIYIGGQFTSYQGVENAGLVRLHPNGVLDEGFDAGSGEANPFIQSLAVQADGRVLVGGAFNVFGGKPHKNLVRLNRDGSLDRSFNVGAGFDSFVRSVALQLDGRILVAGEFQNINGHPGGLIARLENGPAVSSLQILGTTTVQWMLDGSAPEVPDSVLFEVSTDSGASWAPLGLGEVTTGGWTLGGLSLPASGLVRASGPVRGGLGNGSAGWVRQVESFPALIPLVTNAAAVVLRNPLRAEIEATVESEGDRPVVERGVVFGPSLTNDSPMLGGDGVEVIVAETAGGGAFTVVIPNLETDVPLTCRAYATSARGTAYSDVVHVTAPRPPAVSIAGVSAITSTTATLDADLDADPGAVVLDRGFVYTTVDGVDRLANEAALNRQSVAGITPYFEAQITGLLPGTRYWFSAYVESDLGMVYSPAFSRFTTSAPPPAPLAESEREEEFGLGSEGGIGAMAATGMVDAGYDPDVDAGAFYVQALATQPDGKTIVAGAFPGIGGVAGDNVVRLNPDGTVDATFAAETNGIVYSAVVQDDGKILLGGLFTTVNGQDRGGIARLLADGTLESASTFNPGTGADNLVCALALQPDGKILIGGLFQNYNGTPRNRIARLNADGTLESSATFNTGTGPDGAVFTLGLQADGKILLGGDFTQVNGTGRSRLARLNANGSLDTSFDPGTGANDKVSCILPQPDGQILIGGYFTTIQGSAANRMARLDPDGSLESSSTFNPGSGADHRVYSIALQMDGKILIGGLFENFNGVSRSRIARLNGDGSVDGSFNPGAGTDGEVDAVAIEANGGILIGGQFTTADGVARSHMARYGNDLAAGSLNVVDATHLSWTRTGPGPEVSTVVFQLSTDGGATWTRLGGGGRMGAGDDWEINGLALPPTGIVRAVGRTAGGFLSASSGLVGAMATLSFAPGDIAAEQLGGVPLGDGVTVDMGEPALGASSDRTFTVRNMGAGLLAGVQISLSGLDAAEFGVVTAPAATVEAGGVTQFTLRFTPGSHGEKNAMLRIFSNDPDENPRTILLMGAAFRDDLGSYAGDGINDNWQTRYFGPPPNANAGPLVDFDGDGYDNRFENIAGLNPLSRESRFNQQLEPTHGIPGQMPVTFGPCFPDRTYTLLYSVDLSPGSWQTIPGAIALPINANGFCTVIDPAPGNERRFYRVEIDRQ
ncbi:MAG: choice-of-anchor D domain-containing protein [Verrucomicrobiales bacterium]|nr:choice-of-anchor D domain-containing protein [Verrucomicrobiales bacterium]